MRAVVDAHLLESLRFQSAEIMVIEPRVVPAFEAHPRGHQRCDGLLELVSVFLNAMIVCGNLGLLVGSFVRPQTQMRFNKTDDPCDVDRRRFVMYRRRIVMYTFIAFAQ